MVSVPGAIPVTVLPVPKVAKAVLLLLQVPPGVPSVNVVEDPAHTLVAPPIEAGKALTLTVAVAEAVQPNPFVTL